MNQWGNLNIQGKLLYVACLINLCIALYLANVGEWMCLFSAFMAAFCGLSTYNIRYIMVDEQQINDRSK